MLRGLLLSIALLSSPSILLARASEKDPKMELAIELLALMDVDQMLTSMHAQLESMISTQIEQVAKCEAMKPAIQEYSRDMTALITTQLRAETFMPEVAQIYVDVFTHEELEAVLAFYRSPVGQKMLAKMPELMQRSMTVGQEQMTELMPEIETAAGEFGKKIAELQSECDMTDE